MPGSCTAMPSAKWTSACPTCTHNHTHVLFFMGLLPNATFGPNYQVVSVSWTAFRFPLVTSLMRFGLTNACLSICQLTFCVSGTPAQTGSPSSWQPRGRWDGGRVCPGSARSSGGTGARRASRRQLKPVIFR